MDEIRVFDPKLLDAEETIYYRLAQSNQFVNNWVVMELLYKLQQAKLNSQFKPTENPTVM
jgi:hypothetical protein